MTRPVQCAGKGRFDARHKGAAGKKPRAAGQDRGRLCASAALMALASMRLPRRLASPMARFTVTLAARTNSPPRRSPIPAGNRGALARGRECGRARRAQPHISTNWSGTTSPVPIAIIRRKAAPLRRLAADAKRHGRKVRRALSDHVAALAQDMAQALPAGEGDGDARAEFSACCHDDHGRRDRAGARGRGSRSVRPDFAGCPPDADAAAAA